MALTKEASKYDLRIGKEMYQYIYADMTKRKQKEFIDMAQRIPQHDTGVLFEYALTGINPKLKHCKKGKGQDFTDKTDAKMVTASGTLKRKKSDHAQRARVIGKNKKGGLRVGIYVPFNDTFRYFFIPESVHKEQALSIQFIDGELSSMGVAPYEVESIQQLAKMKGNSELEIRHEWI